MRYGLSPSEWNRVVLKISAVSKPENRVANLQKLAKAVQANKGRGGPNIENTKRRYLEETYESAVEKPPVEKDFNTDADFQIAQIEYRRRRGKYIDESAPNTTAQASIPIELAILPHIAAEFVRVNQGVTKFQKIELLGDGRNFLSIQAPGDGTYVGTFRVEKVADVIAKQTLDSVVEDCSKLSGAKTEKVNDRQVNVKIDASKAEQNAFSVTSVAAMRFR